MTDPLLISLRPCFADLVFLGVKRAELRRRFARITDSREVFIYVTSPERSLRGGFRVDEVWKGTPDQIWDQVSSLAGIGKADFDAYYRGSAVAYALSIADVWELEEPVELDSLKEELGAFTVPQSWRYVKPREYELFRNLRAKRPVKQDSHDKLGSVDGGCDALATANSKTAKSKLGT